MRWMRPLFKLDVGPMQFFKELYRETNDDAIFNGAATLGFYLTLAIFPAVIFMMALLPYLPVPHIDEAIMALLRQVLPPQASQMFVGVVEEVMRRRSGGLLSFGLLAGLWAASTGMYAIMQQLNVSYDVNETRGFVRARLIAIGLSLLFIALVIGGLSLIVLGGSFEEWLGDRFGLGSVLLVAFAVFRWVVIVIGLLLAFALIYFLAPDVKQRFVFITPGSVIGVAVLAVASLAFAWYVQNVGNYSATYGSIGAVIVLMLWLYIAGLVILFGSEINSLIEHHAPGGKEKGEHENGEKQRDPVARERARRVAPDRAPTNPALHPRPGHTS
ncbi:MAG TPA: YihY/virulence factor BrkB family protein [Burkholderiaceae bacterium]|nr:YihY/virulence factor BrkB family protein [Burkholderiaceae bacterium]